MGFYSNLVLCACPTSDQRNCLYQSSPTINSSPQYQVYNVNYQFPTILNITYGRPVNSTNSTYQIIGWQIDASYTSYSGQATYKYYFVKTDTVSVANLASIGASYETGSNSNTLLRQMSFVYKNNSMVNVPSSYAIQTNTTQASLILQGVFMGIFDQGYEDKIYIYLSYGPNLTGSISTNIQYFLGDPSLIQTQMLSWSKNPPADAIAALNLTSTLQYLQFTYDNTSKIVSYTVPSLNNDATGQAAIGYYPYINLQIFIYGNEEVSLQFNLLIAQPTCLTTSISINIIQTTITATLYNQKLLYVSFPNATNTQNLDCGPYNYQMQYQDPSQNWIDIPYNYNATMGILYSIANTSEFYYQSSNPTLSQAQSVWNLRYNISFVSALNLKQSTLSSIFSIQWVSPCYGNFYNIQQNQLLWQTYVPVKVEFQNNKTFSSPWYDLVSDKYQKVSNPSVTLCTINYNGFAVIADGSGNGSSAISMPNTTSSNNIFINQTSKDAVGNYTISYSGFLNEAPSITNNQSFIIEIIMCQVTSITYPNTTIYYTLTQPSFVQSFQGVTQSSTTSCGYKVTTQLTIPSIYTDLVSWDEALQEFTIISQSNLTYLSLSPLIIPYTTTTDGGPDSGINSTSGNFTINLINPCETTSFIAPISLSLTMYAYSQSNLVSFLEILDTVSESQSDSFYCGERNYQLQSAQITSSPYLNIILDYSSKTITVNSTQISGQAVTTITQYSLTSTLVNYPSVTSNINTLTVIVLDPCWNTSLLSQSFSSMIVTAGQSSNSTANFPPTYIEQSFTDFNDSVSLFYNVQICGSKSYALSFVNTTSAGNATISNIYTKINSTGNFIIVDATQNQNQYGDYIVTLTAKLTSYQNISSASATFQVTILPCVVNYLSLNTSDSTNNLPSDRQIQYVLMSQTKFSFSPYQGNICNYGWNITYSLGEAQNVTWVDLNQTWIAKFYVFASNRDQINNYTVNLTYQLTDYPPSIYNVPSNYQSAYQVNYKSDIDFIIQIEDPCKITKISYQPVNDLQAFYGFPEKISGQISGVNYTNWTNYTSYFSVDKPVSQMYFEDTVSRQMQYFEFCGGMTFNFTSQQQLDFPISSIKGYNGYNITFSPPFTLKKSEMIDIILTVSFLNPNLTQTLTANFKVIAYVVVPPLISGLTVAMGAYNKISLPIGNFYFQQPNGDLSIIKQVYSAYQFLNWKRYPNNTQCEPLVQSGEFLPLPLFAQFDSSNVQFTFINQYSQAGQYYFIVCLNFTGFSASYVTQFKHTVLNQLSWSTETLKSPTMVLSNQFISSCSTANDPMWKYQLPQPSVPNNVSVKITVNLGPYLYGYLEYDESIRTILQIQKIEFSGNYNIQVKLQASTGTKAQYQITVTCGCQQTQSFNSIQMVQDQQQIIQNEAVIAPQPKIKQITNQGLIKVQFGTQMQVTQEQLAQILNNSYVDSNNQTKKILNLTIYNPSGRILTPVLIYTFTVKSFTNQSLDIQIDFANPLYVSCLSQKDSIQVEILAYQFFKSTQNIFVQPNSTKTNLKNIPQQLQNPELVYIIQEGANILQSFLAANAFASPLLAGSLQLVLGVIRQLQIQTNLMLITLNYPATVTIFFSSLMTIASLTFYDCTKFFNQYMNLDNPNPLNDQFEEMFYGQVYFIINFNFPIFILPAVILGLVIVKILSYIRYRQVKNFFKKVLNHFVWNFFISYMHEMYILISINSLINYTYLEFNNLGNICNSVVTLIFSSALLFYPLTIIPFYAYNFKSFLHKKKVFVKTYGVLLENFNLYRTGRSVLIYLGLNYLRKFSLMAFLVIFRDQPNVLLFFGIHQIIFVFSVNSTIRPFTLKLDQLQDMIEEITYLITTYHMICFTDWIQNPDTQNQIGMSLAIFTVISLSFSLLKVGINNIIQVYTLLKRSYIKLKRYLKLEKQRQEKRQIDLLKFARQQQLKLQQISIYKQTQNKKYKILEKNQAQTQHLNAEIKPKKMFALSQNRTRIGIFLQDLNLSVIKEEEIQQPSPKIEQYLQYDQAQQQIDYYKNTYQGLSDLTQSVQIEKINFDKTRNMFIDQNAQNNIGIEQMIRLDEIERKIQNL